MRILDTVSDNPLENVVLYLTFPEALELRDSLDELLKKPLNNHAHVADENFQKEITVCIYDENKLNGLNERSINLILHNK